MRNNLEFWLNEEEMQPNAGGEMGSGGQVAPASDANTGVGNPDNFSAPDPAVTNMDQQNSKVSPGENPQDDVSQDPASPHMPEEKEKVDDFEKWKNTYLKESITADSNKMLDLLKQVRDIDTLSPYQKKFVEDNHNIQLLRRNSDVEKASKEIRKDIKQQLDKNNPATSMVNHIADTLESSPMINEIFIKMNGYANLKSDLHRKLIAALTGSVQVGSGGNTEDIIFNEKTYSIMTSTRMNARWGDVMIGNWSLKEDDAQKYLSESELKRLEDGSPEEKDVLRRRIVMESISELFETRAFIITVVGDNGTIFHLGWDISNSLRSAYTDGKLIVKTKTSDNSECMITQEGEIVPYVDLDIMFAKETGEQDQDGKPKYEYKKFIERKEGMLFLCADIKTIRESVGALQGFSLKEVPYNGNPSDLKVLMRCVYSTYDLLLKQC